MDQMRQWTLLTILAVLVILGAGYFLLVQPRADQAAEIRESAEAQLVANTQLQQEIARLNKQAEDLPRQQAKLATFASRIPANPALPSLIRSLTDAADSAGVELVALAPAAPEPVVAPATAPTAAAAPAPAAPVTAAAAAPPEPLYAIPLTLSIRGGYVQVQQFFSNVEDLQRTFQVAQFSIVPPTNTGTTSVAVSGVSVAMVGRVYMTVPSGVAPVATPGPTATAPPATAPSPSASPTASATPAQ